MIEVGDHRRALMFGDEIDDALRQAILTRQVNPIFHMGNDDLRAGNGIQPSVGVHTFGAVFDKEIGPDRFADIMIIGTHTSEQGISADGSRGTFAHVAYNQCVMVRAGRLQQKLAQQWMRRVAIAPAVEAGS